MALLYIDGFDHYTDTANTSNNLSNLNPAYSLGNGTGYSDHFVCETMPELGGRGLQFRWGARNANQRHRSQWLTLPTVTAPASGEIRTVGFHLYMDSLPIREQTGGFIGWGTGGTPYRCLRVITTGELVYWEGDGRSGSEIASSGFFFTDDILYHIEFKTLFHASAGEIEVRVNGQTVFTLDNINTMPDVISSLQFGIGVWSGGTTGFDSDNGLFYIDNMFIWDGTGDVNNDFLGERNVATVFVDSDESPQDWTLSGGSDAFDLLNDVPPDPGNNFIESATASEISKFGTAELPSLDISVVGVQTTVQAYKTGTSDTDIDIGLDIGSDLDVGGSPLIQDQATYFTHITEVHPDTGDPLTPAEVQNALIHIERTL